MNKAISCPFGGNNILEDDSFTIAINDPGFGVFDPFGSRTANIQLAIIFDVGQPLGVLRYSTYERV